MVEEPDSGVCGTMRIKPKSEIHSVLLIAKFLKSFRTSEIREIASAKFSSDTKVVKHLEKLAQAGLVKEMPYQRWQITSAGISKLYEMTGGR